MPGVPKSIGCRSCRRKKKGCDLQKPVCGQCGKLKISCEWDDKRWTFVNREMTAVESSKLTIRQSNVSHMEELSIPALSNEYNQFLLTRPAYEVSYVAKFWEAFLPKDNGASVGGVRAGYWVGSVQDLATFNQDVTGAALLAVSTQALGCLSGDPTMLRNGTQLYAKALRKTNQALQDPNGAQSNAVLAACKLLSMFENFRLDASGGMSTQGQDWLKHVEGMNRIIELRGPAKHVSRHGHDLFEESRLSAMIAGIALRKPIFLADSAWCTIPWQISPRNLRDELCDILLSIPDILLDQDLLLHSLTGLGTNSHVFETHTKAQEHIYRCILVATQLQGWERRAIDMGQAKSSTRTAGLIGPLTLLEICKDHGYGFFHIVNQYWAACIILYGSTRLAKRHVMAATCTLQPQPLPAMMKLPEIPVWMNPQPAASNIAECASHYFAEEAGLFGVLQANFPIGTALHYFAAIGLEGSQEMEQLRHVFSRGSSGQIASGFLNSMAGMGPRTVGDTDVREEHSAKAKAWFGFSPKAAI